MEGLNFENVTQLLQLVAIVCGIGIFWWKVPSKREMERADDLLRVDFRENQKQIRVAFEKIDANSKEFHANVSKLNDKIDAEARDLRADIRELNQDHRARRAYHNEKAQN